MRESRITLLSEMLRGYMMKCCSSHVLARFT